MANYIQNDRAQIEEKIGRDIFQELADQRNWKVEYTTDMYDFIDLHLQIVKQDRTITASGEIKNRAASAIKYQTHIITLHKIKALINDKSDLALFINIMGDNIFIYDCYKLARLIKEGKIKPYKKWLPDRNVKGTGYHQEAIIEVDKSLAVHLKKVDGQWVKQTD